MIPGSYCTATHGLRSFLRLLSGYYTFFCEDRSDHMCESYSCRKTAESVQPLGVALLPSWARRSVDGKHWFCSFSWMRAVCNRWGHET